MRTVRGLEEARRALCGGRRLDLDTAPEGVLRKTAEAFGKPLTPLETVQAILAEVRQNGDEALRDLTSRLDGADLVSLEVPLSAAAEAYHELPDSLVDALRVAADRVRKFHEASMPESWHDSQEGYGELVTTVGRVGAYVPGGTAIYPSTVLMTAIPAKVAGVSEVFLTTPVGADGAIAPVVLVAADIAGVDRVFQVGGAQAIAALAYGTETVPRVDMVCGPGNIFVTLAKKLLYGEVGIDGLYGPTETLLVADGSANPTLCAADLLAQAEHDTMARPVLITTSSQVAEAVAAEVAVRVERLDRASTARGSVEKNGCIAVVESVDEALDLAAEFAPEHLSLMVEDPGQYRERVRNAGAVFLGEHSHEVLGDYVAGPSHVMPTGGTARFGSGLGVRSFLKFSPVVDLGKDTAARLGRAASVLGRAEGLTAHAEAAEIREELSAR